MREKRCLFVVTHYCPLVGGGQSVYDAYARQRPDLFQVLTSFRDYTTGKEVPGFSEFDQSAPYKITRIAKTRPDIGASKVSLVQRITDFLESLYIKWQLVRTIREICADDHIDVVCVSASEAFSWLPVALGAKMDIPILYYTHGEEFSQQAYSAKAERQRRAAIQAASGVVAVSNFTRDLLIKRYGASPQKTRLINNGVDFAAFATPVPKTLGIKRADSENLTVIATGRMVARKGFDMLVEAWPVILDQVENAKLILAGKGPMFEPLRERIEQLGLGGSINQMGYVSDDVLVELYQSADLFVMPNRTMDDGDTEGFGLVFLEAAAAGATSVGGRAGGATDAIFDGKTGLLVDGRDREDIARAVVSLLSDEGKRNQMAAAANKNAELNDWSCKVDELLDFFDELAGQVR